MATALERIRAATAELHQQLETQTYSRALLDGSLPIALYASFLRALWVIHGEFEQTLERTQEPALRAVFDPASFERRGLLERDLAYLKRDLEQVDGAVLQALVLAQELRLGAARQPAQLLGFAYVLEGSQLGGLVQSQALRLRPELQHGGLSYLAGAGAATRARFSQFVVRLERALGDEAAIDAAIAGAQAAFGGFARILGAVAPERIEPPWLAAELNGDAGMHAVPEQLREVVAALRAAERSHREFAYYRARYGERGLRFTRSDSAWLVTLAREGEEGAALRQVHWLGRVLAARGMPRILLELHLLRLHEALLTALPEQAAVYASLRVASENLRSERLLVVPKFDALREGTALATEASISGREAATLMLGAVADEKRGVAKAVSSLTSWLCDATRFSSDWIATLDELCQRARRDD